MNTLFYKSSLFFFFTFISINSFGQCYTNLEGVFHARTSPINNPVGPFNDCEGQIWEGMVRWEYTGTNDEYQVFSIDSALSVELEDMSMGVYYLCYETMDQSGMPNGDLRLSLDSCNDLTIIGESQWGEVFSIDDELVDSTGTVLSFKWTNDYGEGGAIELTRTDSLLWTDGITAVFQKKLSEKQLDIFPNPTNEVLFIKTDAALVDAQFSIISISGKILLQNVLTSNSIDISSVESGIYFLEISDMEKGDRWVKKLIIE